MIWWSIREYNCEREKSLPGCGCIHIAEGIDGRITELSSNVMARLDLPILLEYRAVPSAMHRVGNECKSKQDTHRTRETWYRQNDNMNSNPTRNIQCCHNPRCITENSLRHWRNSLRTGQILVIYPRSEPQWHTQAHPTGDQNTILQDSFGNGDFSQNFQILDLRWGLLLTFVTVVPVVPEVVIVCWFTVVVVWVLNGLWLFNLPTIQLAINGYSGG